MGYNLNQINPTYEIVEDIKVGTATTSVNFSSLANYDETDDLMVIINHKMNAVSAYLYMYVNGNTTNSNYYLQSLSANQSSLGAARSNLPLLTISDQNGYSDFYRLKICVSNNIFESHLKSISKYNYASGYRTILTERAISSVFSITAITSLMFTTTGISNGIGVGSRFTLLRKKPNIIQDIKLTSTTTQIDFTNLEFNANNEYELKCSLIGVSTEFVSISFNENTTPTNYQEQRLEAVTSSVIGARNNNNYLGVISNLYTSVFRTSLNVSNNNFGTWKNDSSRGLGANAGSYLEVEKIYGSSTFTLPSGITSIRLTVPSGFAAGSRFQLIKLK